MSSDYRFSWSRFRAIVRKEFRQMLRDKFTFGMIAGIPLMQLMLFGYAINTDPKQLPTYVIMGEHTAYTRSLLASMEHTGYFRIEGTLNHPEEGRELLERTQAQFIVTIPPGFTRKLLRNEHPDLLVEVDATDPVATSTALAALQRISQTATQHDNARNPMTTNPPPFNLVLHQLYNPEGRTQLNIVPGLLGVILTMTMSMLTAMALSREREQGTLENLLAKPLSPAEVMFGKICPFLVVGALQVTITLTAAKVLFSVPIVGSLLLLIFGISLFIAANLAVGFLISIETKNQMQAGQMAQFFFLPSMMLSGFLFPFRGMPDWAQTLGEIFPLTHFMRFIRSVMLKGSPFSATWHDLWPIVVFTLVVAAMALKRYRTTLD